MSRLSHARIMRQCLLQQDIACVTSVKVSAHRGRFVAKVLMNFASRGPAFRLRGNFCTDAVAHAVIRLCATVTRENDRERNGFWDAPIGAFLYIFSRISRP